MNSGVSNKIKQAITSSMSGNCYLVMIYLLSIIFLIIFTYSLYLRKELTKHENSLINMRKIPDDDEKSISVLENSDYISSTSNGLEYGLIDYTVYGSFNSCCHGEVINGHVSIEALQEVIKQGVRLLDFEIYFKDGKAVVAAGRNNIYMKDTYNELEIGTVLAEVKKLALGGVANSTDPLLLNFRIVSKNSNIFHILEKKIMKHLSDYLVSLHLSNDMTDKNILTTPFKNLKNKVVIFINDQETNNFKDNKRFFEIVNAHGGQGKKGKLKYVTDYQVQNEGSPSQYIEEMKEVKFGITMPDVMSAINSKWRMHQKCGFQGVLMNFGIDDDNLKSYRKKFIDGGKAFILKDSKIRRKRRTISLPLVQNKGVDPEPKLYELSSSSAVSITGKM
tara:strand:- start:6323 stop:7495 length:1173 start_codon:yes stop_codon:yes gene_type:complete